MSLVWGGSHTEASSHLATQKWLCRADYPKTSFSSRSYGAMSAETLTEDCPGGVGPTGQPGPPQHAPLLFSYRQNLDLLQPCLGIWVSGLGPGTHDPVLAKAMKGSQLSACGKDLHSCLNAKVGSGWGEAKPFCALEATQAWKTKPSLKPKVHTPGLHW